MNCSDTLHPNFIILQLRDSTWKCSTFWSKLRKLGIYFENGAKTLVSIRIENVEEALHQQILIGKPIPQKICIYHFANHINFILEQRRMKMHNLCYTFHIVFIQIL